MNRVPRSIGRRHRDGAKPPPSRRLRTAIRGTTGRASPAGAKADGPRAASETGRASLIGLPAAGTNRLMQDSYMNMNGKTVLITGATSGIGLEAAVMLARKGAHTVIVGRNPAKTEACLAEIR